MPKVKLKISFTTSAGVNVRTKRIGFCESYQYADYYNMMKINDGEQPTFTDEQLVAFRDHTDPYGHPDVNWYDEIF